MFAFRELLNARKQELAEIITAEHGKVVSDALGEVSRGLEVVELAAWGDSGYGTWAEPILARLARDGAGGALRCAGLVVTGQLQTPSADFVMPERVTAP